MESSSAEKSDEDVNYGLGLNEDSDRVLRLEIERQESVTGLEVETLNLNVSSLRLAASSPYFDRLFNNGMKESQNKAEFSMRIHESEEAGFMDMLKCVYNKPLTAGSRDELLGVLMVADKYQVTSCAIRCVNMLRNMHMDFNSALDYIDLTAPAFAPLVAAALKSLCSHFCGFYKFQQQDAISLPLCKLEPIFRSKDFQVNSEDALLDFMVEWARKNYGDDQLEERRDILTNRLLGYVCLPCLTPLKLKKMVDNSDFHTERVLKLAINALYCKIDSPRLPNPIPEINEDVLRICSFPSRVYNSHRAVFFDIKKQDCSNMIRGVSRFYSDAFYLAGKRFYLFASRSTFPYDSLELFVEMRSLGSCNLAVQFYALKKSPYHFQWLYTEEHVTFTGTRKCWSIPDMFHMPWTVLMSDGNCYMVDGAIHVGARLTFKG